MTLDEFGEGTSRSFVEVDSNLIPTLDGVGVVGRLTWNQTSIHIIQEAFSLHSTPIHAKPAQLGSSFDLFSGSPSELLGRRQNVWFNLLQPHLIGHYISLEGSLDRLSGEYRLRRSNPAQPLASVEGLNVWP